MNENSVSSRLSTITNTGCRRDGDYVVIPTGADLPPTCVKCNAPAVLPVRKRVVHWHHPAWYLLLLAAGIGYAVVLIFRQKCEVSPGLCARHGRIRRMKTAFLSMAAILSFVLWGVFEEHGMVNAGAIAFIAALGLLMALFSAMKILKAASISATEAKLSGCGEPFLKHVEGMSAAEAPRQVERSVDTVGCPFCGRAYSLTQEDYVCPSCAAPMPSDAIGEKV